MTRMALAALLVAFLPGGLIAANDRGDADPIPYTRIGKVKPRHAREIASSNWSVGAETMDRDYTVYKNWREYLGPLGVKKARIQAGWAKTEKAKGRYEWAWLDEIVPDMVEQGVEPWVCLCYGNGIYPGGGGTGLGGTLPSSAQALAAWDRFVAAFVDRYGEHVDEWEIWNEPRGEAAKTQYPQFLVRTAEIIRRLQPQATIIGCSTAGVNTGQVEAALRHLRESGKLHLVNEITYHPYKSNPDASYGQVRRLRELVTSYSDAIIVRQGENGCPSKRGSYGALSQYDWDEESQAKWALRRVLGDLGRDIPSSYFAICDMHYRGGDGGTIVNYKGVLATNPDKTVAYAKPAYRALQHVTAIFDDRLERIPGYRWEIRDGSSESADRLSVFGYAAASGRQIVTIWRHTDRPGENPEREYVDLVLPAGNFDDPVCVDLLTGDVYSIPEQSRRSERGTGRWEFERVPVFDSVVLIAERGLVPLTSESRRGEAP
ncbi:MAG: hypothetical protein PVH68_17355 [Armatimonadota bacterium]